MANGRQEGNASISMRPDKSRWALLRTDFKRETTAVLDDGSGPQTLNEILPDTNDTALSLPTVADTVSLARLPGKSVVGRSG